MIKANELREGNKVISGTHNLLNATIQNIMPHSGIVTLREVSTYDTFDKIDPIPITPEWLERCGQKCENGKGWEYQINVGALKWYFRYNTEWYSEIGGIYIDSKVQFVHQLQNLNFALTGEELNFKDL